MAKIHISQLSEVIPCLPEIQVFNPASNSSGKEADLFLCALGFEPRCLTIPDKLEQYGYTVTRAIYFEYATNRDDNAANRPQLLKHLNSISDNVLSVEADDPGFSRYLRELLESFTLGPENQEPVVLFDISVASNRLLMKCMKVFLELNITLNILYSEAAIYHPTREQYEMDPEKWRGQDTLGLEHGVSDVNVSEEYSGYHIDQLPDCVILFPNFNQERARAVIGEVDPSLLILPANKILWLLGVPHLEQDHWRIDAMRSINGLGPDAPQYEVSTYDYRDTLMTLDSIYQEKVGAYKFTMSPMGSKLQALGAALFCYLRPDVRVVFAIPKEYNAAQYSKGCKAAWIIDFGCLREIRRLLDKVGLINVED